MTMEKILPHARIPGTWDEFIDFSMIPPSRFRRFIIALVHKYIMRIPHFADYVSRDLMRHGVVCDISSSVSTTSTGWQIVITVNIKGVHESLLQKNLAAMEKLLKLKLITPEEYEKIRSLVEKEEEGEEEEEEGVEVSKNE